MLIDVYKIMLKVKVFCHRWSPLTTSQGLWELHKLITLFWLWDKRQTIVKFSLCARCSGCCLSLVSGNYRPNETETHWLQWFHAKAFSVSWDSSWSCGWTSQIQRWLLGSWLQTKLCYVSSIVYVHRCGPLSVIDCVYYSRHRADTDESN